MEPVGCLVAQEREPVPKTLPRPGGMQLRRGSEGVSELKQGAAG